MTADDLALIAWKANEFDEAMKACQTTNRHFVVSRIEYAVKDLASVRAHRLELVELLKEHKIPIPQHIKDKI